MPMYSFSSLSKTSTFSTNLLASDSRGLETRVCAYCLPCPIAWMMSRRLGAEGRLAISAGVPEMHYRERSGGTAGVLDGVVGVWHCRRRRNLRGINCMRQRDSRTCSCTYQLIAVDCLELRSQAPAETAPASSAGASG